MNNLQQNLTRRESVGTLADGATFTINVNGDYAYIDTLTAPVELSVNGQQFALCRVGATLQGTPGRAELQTFTLRNETGAPVSFRVIHGLGTFSNPANIVIQNPNFTLAPEDVTGIRGATETQTPGFDLLTDTAQTYAACRGLSVLNTGATTIKVLTKDLPAGMSVSWSCNGRFDRLGDIAIDATGGSALITFVS